MNQPIIGITGPARSGKDTFAGILISDFGFTRVALADPLRRMVASLTGLSFAQLLDSPEKEIAHPKLGGISPRRAMQTLGTEWGRDIIWRDLWVEHAMDQAEAAGSAVVIPDVRFENEAEAIRARGGVVVHMKRPALNIQVEAHASEAGVRLRFQDWMVLNDQGMEQLRDKAREFCWSLTQTRLGPFN